MHICCGISTGSLTAVHIKPPSEQKKIWWCIPSVSRTLMSLATCSTCMDPSTAEMALQAFRHFHDAYKMRYQQH